MSFQTKESTSDVLNTRGYKFLKRQEYEMAIECYQLAFRNAGLFETKNTAEYLSFEAYADYLLAKLGRRSHYLSQEAFALNKLARYDEAYTKASEALELNPNSAFAKDQLTDAEDQMQSTKHSYDCEEGQWFFSTS